MVGEGGGMWWCWKGGQHIVFSIDFITLSSCTICATTYIHIGVSIYKYAILHKNGPSFYPEHLRQFRNSWVAFDFWYIQGKLSNEPHMIRFDKWYKIT